MNAALERTEAVSPPKIGKTERRVITKAVKRFLDKYADKEPLMPKLLGLDAALHALKYYDRRKVYEPKDVFEVIYERFGDELFSQYTHSFSNIHPPTPDELNSPTLEGLSPAAHYFTKSAALWEYGMETFGLHAMATDRYRNTVLIMAIKQHELAVATSILNNTPTHQQRLAFVQHQNWQGETALSVATLAASAGQTEEYQELIELLAAYSLNEERPD